MLCAAWVRIVFGKFSIARGCDTIIKALYVQEAGIEGLDRLRIVLYEDAQPGWITRG